MFSIQFNNLNSYRNLGLVIEHKPNIPIGEKDINNIYIQGRNGSLTEDLGTYRDIEISINFGFKDNNLINKTRLIKQWFNDITDNKLIFSSDTEVFYKVKYVKCDGFERGLRTLGRFNVIFVCEPFSYLFSGLETIEIVNNSTLYNEGTYKSEPYVKIYGEGDITLNINTQIIKLENINNYIELDSEIQECYKNAQNCNNKMIGEFPILQVGENRISWTGNINKIEITPNWRCL